MEKEISGINTIKYGELQIYYPLKFNTSLSYDQICNYIIDHSLFDVESYYEKCQNKFSSSLAKNVTEFNNDNPSMRMKISNYDSYMSHASDALDLKNMDLKVFVNISDKSMEMEIVNPELDMFKKRAERLEKEYCQDFYSYYGRNFFVSHERFLFFPLQIKLNNQKTVFLFAILYVFSNKTGILKLELPLINIDSTPLKSNDIDQYISDITCSWKNDFKIENSEKDIVKFYLKSLFANSKIDVLKFDGISHIILSDFDGIPHNVETLANTLQEDIFRIIAAPVPERACTSYERDAIEYLSHHSYGNHNMQYILKSTGGCLSFVDQLLLQYHTKLYKESYNLSEIDEENMLKIYNDIALNLQLNAEMALIIVLLKKINYHNSFLNKAIFKKELSKCQTDFWENTKYICELQDGCYGTVYEQISIFEKMMSHYLKPELTTEKLSAIDNILREKELKKNNAFQNFISIAGMLLVIMFGLPTIHDTLSILRKTCTFIPKNIPFITVNNLSIFLWFIINLVFIIYLIIRRND